MKDLTNYQENQEGAVTPSETVLNIVMKSIKAIYPAWRTTIKSQAELDNMKREWLIGFVESNIKTDKQINRGLKLARADKNPFLPSIGQFIEWCKSPDPSHRAFNTKLLENKGTKLTPSEVKKMLADNKKAQVYKQVGQLPGIQDKENKE